MVEVFKTNVAKEKQAAMLADMLLRLFRPVRINFDLEDCDKILRVEGKDIPAEEIMETLKRNGYQCQVME